MLQKVKIFGLLFLLFATACKSSQEPLLLHNKPADVQVLATIHKFHITNPNYPYARVTQLIGQFNPDIIAVEIRPEDLKKDTAYLAQFYPLEMRQVLLDFPSEKVRGLDWYGDEMRGKTLEVDVFRNEKTELGKIKKLERELNRDSLIAPRLLPLVELGKQQAELARESTAANMNNGQYDDITRAFYEILEAAVENTPYQAYTDFNRRRDEIITENIIKLVHENPGKRLIFLIGANHRARAIRALEAMPANEVRLIPVED